MSNLKKCVMCDLKNKTVEDVLSNMVLRKKLKEEYLAELIMFEKENNKDPYNSGQLCTNVISEVKAETPAGLIFLRSFIKVSISVDQGWDDLQDFETIKL